jgi:pimeloyl-ACP methyl ester carboxylesterase
VRYLESGEGQALVLLHAFPLSADQWLPQLHRVPKGWRFIAPDLVAFAAPVLRSRTRDSMAFQSMTTQDDVIQLMLHLEVDRAAVCGVSMGGYVAFRHVAARAETRDGLVLANTRATADTDEARAAAIG